MQIVGQGTDVWRWDCSEDTFRARRKCLRVSTYRFDADTQNLLISLPSPKLNHALLSRSEVVALINTLHRFTESLHAVNNFRTIWADAEKAKKQTLLDATEVQNIPKASVSVCNGYIVALTRKISCADEAFADK